MCRAMEMMYSLCVLQVWHNAFISHALLILLKIENTHALLICSLDSQSRMYTFLPYMKIHEDF